MFHELMNDRVTIKTIDGKTYTDIAASVQRNRIFTQRTDIPIRSGDQIIRITPAGVEEIFIVEAPGFHGGMEDIPATYQMRVRRDTQAPTYPSPTFTHNTLNVGTVINSPIQQGGAHTTMNQTVTYSRHDMDDLRHLVDVFENHLDDLGLDASSKRKASVQIATIKAQIEDEPDPVIVRQAGGTLKTITEEVIAGLIVVAATNPTVWTQIHAIMSKLF